MIVRFGSALALATLLAAPSERPLAAQQSARGAEPVRVTLRGVVVDALYGDPLANAMLRLVDQNRGMLADSLGRFAFAGVETGVQTLAVKQYGYEEIVVEIMVTADPAVLRIELDPGPYALEGFTVVADRLEVMKQRMRSRRNATAMTVQALDQARLARSAARDMLEFLQQEAFVQSVPCPYFMMGTSCILRRGREAAPRVYIDEAPVIGGMDQLALYRPHELYTVEVFARGLEIHAYTHQFMDRMARRPVALIPIELP